MSTHKNKQQLLAELEDLRQQRNEDLEHYHRLLEALPLGVYVSTLPENRIIHVNPAGLRLLRAADTKQLLGKSIIDLAHPDYHEQLRECHQRVASGLPVEPVVASRLVRLDGAVIDVERSLARGRYRGQTVFQSLVWDVTDRKQAEMRLRAAIDGMSDGFLLWDAQDRLVMINEALRRRESDSLAVLRPGVLFADAMSKRVELGLVEQAIGREQAHIEERLERHRRADGEPIEQKFSDGRWMEIREYRTLDGGTVTFRNDITERKRTEEELARYRSRLEELVEERTQALRAAQQELLQSERLAAIGKLTATVSHELRNPLGTIQTSLYTLLERLDETDAVSRRALDRIERNIERCVTIIEELLAYTRARELQCTTVAVDEWCRELFEDAYVPADVTIDLQCRTEQRCFFDPNRLRQAVLNLVQNAWQAILEREERPLNGKIEIVVQVLAGRLRIDIADNGPGIVAETKERIFEPLFSTKTFGVGLGLQLVKQIVEQHGGEIEIDSEEDKGTTVTLWLPQRAMPMASG